MFVAWCLLNGLGGELHTTELPEELSELREGKQTPGEWFLKTCDEKFTDEDLNDEGNRFASDYFNDASGKYINDYTATLGKRLPSVYHVADSWQNYDLLAPVIAKRFRDWKTPRKFWQIWRKD